MSRSHPQVSRRGLMGHGLIWAGGALIGAGLAAEAASAQSAKLAPAVAHYQETPKGKAQCDTCASFLAPSGCKLVTGKISPSGWCMFYAAKH